jgi:magnesium and cobalt transporter
MEGSPSQKHQGSNNKSRFKKLISFFLNLFGKKTKKSFFSVISHLLEDYEKEGLINVEEKKMFKNIASFGDKKVSNIMTPRADIIAVAHDATLEKIKKIITTDGHTRLPVFKENVDEIIGFIHSKDLAKFLCAEDQDFSVTKILRKILFVPGAMKLLDVMLRMRMARVHVAIVLDEFGGVDGFVTIENLMEEIVGDIEDEHDLPSESSFFRIKKIDGKNFQFGGRVEIEKFEEVLQIKIRRDDEFQTVGGLAMSMFKRVPEIGEEIKKYGLNLKIIDADNRLVKLVMVEKLAKQD